MIKDIVLIQQNIIPNEKGRIIHLIKEAHYLEDIKEVYASEIKRNEIKAWKQHDHMTQRLTVPIGMVRFVLCDDREESETYQHIQEIEMGEDNHYLLVLPPRIWYGFTCISEQKALIINCPNMEHDPKEIIRIDQNSQKIPYNWLK